VFDLWVRAWRHKQARGDMVVVRFADDIVLGFQYQSEAERFWEELAQRLRKFRLELHPDKTRLVEFGRFAAANRQRRGAGKPETFAFLGFTHICGKTRASGRFTVLRQTIRQRLQAKLGEVKTELKRRMHEPIPEMGKWLGAVVGGHMRYYGVPLNMPALFLFRSQVGWLWHRALSQRSQNGRLQWDRMRRLIDRWLPPLHTYHPYPLRRFGVTT
jgi:RNA-directed DNA polymerase